MYTLATHSMMVQIAGNGEASAANLKAAALVVLVFMAQNKI
jgi:hypothetical protein